MLRRFDAAGQSAADCVEQSEALTGEGGAQPAESLGPVEDGEVGALQAFGDGAEHVGQLLDDALVEGDTAFRCRGRGGQPGGFGLCPGEGGDAFGLGLGGFGDLGDQFSLA